MATVVGHVDVCPVCLGTIDPEDCAVNAETGQEFCGPECWAEEVLA